MKISRRKELASLGPYNRLTLCFLCSVLILILFLSSRQHINRTISKLTATTEGEFDCGRKSLQLLSILLVDFRTWKFIKYVPSDWEKYWYSNIERFQYEVCSVLSRAEQINKTIDTLLRITSLQKSIFDKSTRTLPVDQHFSQMHYQSENGSEVLTAIQSIEPLIGLIRDPLTMCPHVSSVPPDLYLEGEFALQSKRYLLLAPSSPYRISGSSVSTTVSVIPPWLYKPGSLKILIDIGSSYFQSRNGNTAEIGTKWFYDYFKAKDIQFDRIIAFEYQPLDTRRVWNELPDDVFPIYTFINVGVEEKESKYNPWKMVEAIAKPSDYVVLKLDIDKPPLESALMKQLLADSNRAKYLIDELFFEKHVSADKNSKEDKLKDSYDLFTKLRQLGVRMHGWP